MIIHLCWLKQNSDQFTPVSSPKIVIASRNHFPKRQSVVNHQLDIFSITDNFLWVNCGAVLAPVHFVVKLYPFECTANWYSYFEWILINRFGAFQQMHSVGASKRCGRGIAASNLHESPLCSSSTSHFWKRHSPRDESTKRSATWTHSQNTRAW